MVPWGKECPCGAVGAAVWRIRLAYRAVAGVCREAGARVADMNVQGPVTGGHRQRFPLWYLALHATIVSPVARSGEPRSRADTQPGSLNSGGKAAAASSSSALGCVEVGGRFGAEAATLLRLLARQRAASVARGSGCAAAA